ncbi:MAG: Ni/Fe hydrogenase subunit alpha, partial [Deltaproteobacteria bacterium]
TRLEGHGRIEIFLDDAGKVARAYVQIPELRGFEKFVVGRPVEEMPQITSRICGVCPTAHHMAATKALDDLYQVKPPSAARKLREMLYCIFVLEDHALHFYFLGGPDFVVGPKASKGERNILGVLGKVGVDVGKRVIATRKELRDLMARLGGKAIHPVFGLPGGVAKPLAAGDRQGFVEAAKRGVDFALFTMKTFEQVVLQNQQYVDTITSEMYTHRTYYMGMVDERNRLNFYEGQIRIVDPQGKEFGKFTAREYLDLIAEHVEPWSYMKFPYLKKIGWKGFVDGADSGVYSVAPMARLNAADGMATPRAQEACEKLFATLGGKPVHHTLAFHWARVVEMIYAAERFLELAEDPEIVDPNVRTIPTAIPKVGMGVVEAPRGTLFHHYETDERGIVTRANLIVATQNNAARIALSVDKAAHFLLGGSNASDEGLLNMVEMAFRAYDPCFGCSTHSLPGSMPLKISIRDTQGNLIREIQRD